MATTSRDANVADADRTWVGSMPDAYERWLAPTVFRPFAVDLAERVAASRPRRVLEVAAGTGVLTRELLAALPGAEIVATDLNAAMVDAGGNRATGANWRQADILALPNDLQGFDVVACQFGVMFLRDNQAGFASMRKAVKPGGRLLASTWAPVEEHAYAALLDEALTALYPNDPPRFVRAVPHGYTDPDVVATDAAAGGFEQVEVQRITLEGPMEAAADVTRGFCLGSPVRSELEARGQLAEEVERVVAEVEARLADGPATGWMSAYVVTGIAPA